MELNENQKHFIKETFFFNPNIPGWGNIAEKLLTTGECIVAGDRCVWLGGVGNFIATERAEGLFGCLKYKFNFEEFAKSGFYQEAKSNFMTDLYNKKLKMEEQYRDLGLLP